MAREPLPGNAPDLGALDLFASVVRLGSLSKAAAAHYISQPSASARIRTLERRLGLSLLERTSTGSVTTTAGALVAQWSEGVLDAAQRLIDGVDALRSERSARLHIVASFTIAEHLVPYWLAVFHNARPDARLELEVANSTRVLERVSAGDVDLGFIESATIPADLHSCVVASDQLLLVVDEHHAWRARRDPVTPELLARTPLVLREAGSGTREVLEHALVSAGATSPRVALELGSTTAVKNAVADGIGPAVLSSLAVSEDQALGRLVAVPTVGLDLRRELRAVWRDDQSLTELARAFLAQARARDAATSA